MRTLMRLGAGLIILSPFVWISWTVATRYPGVVGWMMSRELMLLVPLLVVGAVSGVVVLVERRRGHHARQPRQLCVRLVCVVGLYTLAVVGGGLIYQIWGQQTANATVVLVVTASTLISFWRRGQRAEG